MLGKTTGFRIWPRVIVNENNVCTEDKPDIIKEWYIVDFFSDGKYPWMAKEDSSLYQETVVNN